MCGAGLIGFENVAGVRRNQDEFGAGNTFRD